MVLLYNYYSYPDKKQKYKAKTPLKAAKKIWRSNKYLENVLFYDDNNVLYKFNSRAWTQYGVPKFKQ